MPVTIHAGEQEAHAFLRDHRVGVLATVDPNDEPHAAAIYYAVEKGLTINFLTKTRTKKADNLQHNNHAMLVVYDDATQTTVQITGVASEITDALESNKLFGEIINASLDASGNVVPPIAKLKEGDYIAFRLIPKQVRMAVFSGPKSGDYNAIFKTIVPDAHQA
ncbi:MAG TPA: pyridoxamine 5'-phosphate oxidase family protein [Candidatus Saccharimonadales bacterium]|nr:pyridoxamine 5'-phosphate oxidase family protein [Candidatus Saccharimonadales bacterium]